MTTAIETKESPWTHEVNTGWKVEILEYIHVCPSIVQENKNRCFQAEFISKVIICIFVTVKMQYLKLNIF